MGLRERACSSFVRLCLALIPIAWAIPVVAQNEARLENVEGPSSPTGERDAETGGGLGAPPQSTTDPALAAAAIPDVGGPPTVALRTLILHHDGPPSLEAMLRLQLPDWDVQRTHGTPTFLRVSAMHDQLQPGEALAWIESNGPTSFVVVWPAETDAPQSSPLAGEQDPDWERAFALVVDGLLQTSIPPSATERRNGVRPLTPEEQAAFHAREQREREERERDPQAPIWQEAPTPARSRWHTPLRRDGWFFRFGWVHSFSPRVERWTDDENYDYPTGGLRLAFGRWLTPILNVSVVAHGAYVQANAGEGGLFAQLMLVSQTRFRMGGGIEVGVIRARELENTYSWGWWGFRAYLPMELGVEVNGRGGFFVQAGPTFTQTPIGFYPGYQLSVEWEFE